VCSKEGCKQFSCHGTKLVGGYCASLCEEHADAWDTFAKQTEEYPALQVIEKELIIIELRLMAERNDADEQALRQLFEKREACLRKLYEMGRDWVKRATP